MVLGGGGGEAVADDEGDVCGNRGGAGGERLIFGEAAAEVGIGAPGLQDVDFGCRFARTAD